MDSTATKSDRKQMVRQTDSFVKIIVNCVFLSKFKIPISWSTSLLLYLPITSKMIHALLAMQPDPESY